LKISEYVKPNSIEEAAVLLKSCSAAVIIGGGAFLRLSNREVKLGIDLSEAGLDYIVEKDDLIEIGTMTTFRAMEKSDILKDYYDGVIPYVLGKIMGVQFRNVATVGGTLGGKYGFSDFITALLPLEVNVHLYNAGTMSLEDYLKYREKDIIENLILKKDIIKAVYKDFRNTSTDFPILNVAVAVKEGIYKIAIGARPGTAILSLEASEFFNGLEDKKAGAEKAGEIAAENLQFRSDIRASAEYRKELCKVLVKRALLEVMA
jgi:CO/xanthine dehydrogenase FAD-binding subunit